MVFYRHIQQYFSYIATASFIGRGNRRTRRKPPTCCNSLTDKLYYIMLYRVYLAMNGVRTHNVKGDILFVLFIWGLMAAIPRDIAPDCPTLIS